MRGQIRTREGNNFGATSPEKFGKDNGDGILTHFKCNFSENYFFVCCKKIIFNLAFFIFYLWVPMLLRK